MPKGLQERLANAEALVTKYKAAIAAEAILNNIQPGDQVTFSYGRGETATTRSGTVLTVGDSPRGKLAVIQTGEGIDIETLRVRVADITTNATAAKRTAGAPQEPAQSENAAEATQTPETAVDAPDAATVPPRPPFAQDTDPLGAE